MQPPNWKQLSEELDNDIEDLFMRNSEYSMELIKQRVNKFKR